MKTRNRTNLILSPPLKASFLVALLCGFLALFCYSLNSSLNSDAADRTLLFSSAVELSEPDSNLTLGDNPTGCDDTLCSSDTVLTNALIFNSPSPRPRVSSPAPLSKWFKPVPQAPPVLAC